MNVYICSTLRHLLFSISKAHNESSKKSHILFFYDYQDIDSNTLDTKNLPNNIKITLLSRKKLTKQLKVTFKGKLYLALSLRANNLPKWLKIQITLAVNNLIPELNFSQKDTNLFVFNERNKMSRLFRMMVSDYEMIEDGVGNYYEIPVSFPKNIIRYFQGEKPSSWVFGENKRCKRINVVSPEKLPSRVRGKGYEIDFLNSAAPLDTINNVFKFIPVNANEDEDKLFIIATQPAPERRLKKFSYQINQEIIDYCHKNNFAITMKIHPSENINDYLHIFPKMVFLPSKAPLELQILNSTKKVTVVSLNSSAGLGFEKHCSILKLIPDNDLHRFIDIIDSWEKDVNKLKKVIETTFRGQG